MTKRDADRLAQMSAPDWMVAMQRYYREHGTYRLEDVAKLTAHTAREPKQKAELAETLQKLATKR